MLSSNSSATDCTYCIYTHSTQYCVLCTRPETCSPTRQKQTRCPQQFGVPCLALPWPCWVGQMPVPREKRCSTCRPLLLYVQYTYIQDHVYLRTLGPLVRGALPLVVQYSYSSMHPKTLSHVPSSRTALQRTVSTVRYGTVPRFPMMGVSETWLPSIGNGSLVLLCKQTIWLVHQVRPERRGDRRRKCERGKEGKERNFPPDSLRTGIGQDASRERRTARVQHHGTVARALSASALLSKLQTLQCTRRKSALDADFVCVRYL